MYRCGVPCGHDHAAVVGVALQLVDDGAQLVDSLTWREGEKMVGRVRIRVGIYRRFEEIYNQSARNWGKGLANQEGVLYPL